MMYLGSNAVGMATSLPQFADIAKIECGNYTPTTDELISSKTFNHNLGEVPDLILLYSVGTDNNGENYDKKYVLLVSAVTFPMGAISDVQNYFYFTNTVTKVGATTTSTSMGSRIKSDVATSQSFIVPLTPSAEGYFKANTLYRYVIGKFKEVTSNA